MSQNESVVFVVDDDVSVRESLEPLFRRQGWLVKTFASAPEFLSQPPASVPSCLVLDVALPGLNGLDLQKRVAGERPEMPIIFITGFGNIPMSVRAMKGGAVEFLTKPFGNDELLSAIRNALERSNVVLGQVAEIRALKARYARLTPREREVMGLVVVGLPNKAVGNQLGISVITVKAHRGALMRKMKAKSLPELVNMAARLQVSRIGSPGNSTQPSRTPESASATPQKRMERS